MNGKYGPHDIRGWTPEDILLGVYAGAELWNSTSGDDRYDALNDRAPRPARPRTSTFRSIRTGENDHARVPA